MDVLGRSYMLITSESLRVKLCNVIHCYLNFTQVRNIQDLSFPTNLFKLQLTKPAEQLQYSILMLISLFWQVLINFHLFRLKGKWKATDKKTLRLHLTQTIFSPRLVSSPELIKILLLLLLLLLLLFSWFSELEENVL